MSYQSGLTDAQGPSMSGTFSAAFRVFEQASGGAAIWEETKNLVS